MAKIAYLIVGVFGVALLGLNEENSTSLGTVKADLNSFARVNALLESDELPPGKSGASGEIRTLKPVEAI